jgi:hypothetical protein
VREGAVSSSRNSKYGCFESGNGRVLEGRRASRVARGSIVGVRISRGREGSRDWGIWGRRCAGGRGRGVVQFEFHVVWIERTGMRVRGWVLEGTGVMVKGELLRLRLVDDDDMNFFEMLEKSVEIGQVETATRVIPTLVGLLVRERGERGN